VIRDTARTSDTTTYDFMLQPGGKVTLSDDGFLLEAAGARLVGRVLLPAGVTLTTAAGFGGNINVDDPLSLRIAAPGTARQMEFLLVLVPLARDEKEPAIVYTDQVVRIGTREIRFEQDGRTRPRLLR
jgi:hypothetical protein